MKWYRHDPSAALAGMMGLTLEERGAYYTLIDLLYDRAPHSDVNDELVIDALAIDPRVWRRVKARLIHKGKVHVDENGNLMANRVMSEVTWAQHRLEVTRQMRVQQLKNQELKLGYNGANGRRIRIKERKSLEALLLSPRARKKEDFRGRKMSVARYAMERGQVLAAESSGAARLQDPAGAQASQVGAGPGLRHADVETWPAARAVRSGT